MADGGAAVVAGAEGAGEAVAVGDAVVAEGVVSEFPALVFLFLRDRVSEISPFTFTINRHNIRRTNHRLHMLPKIPILFDGRITAINQLTQNGTQIPKIKSRLHKARATFRHTPFILKSKTIEMQVSLLIAVALLSATGLVQANNNAGCRTIAVKGTTTQVCDEIVASGVQLDDVDEELAAAGTEPSDTVDFFEDAGEQEEQGNDIEFFN